MLALSRATSGVWLKNPPAAITVAALFSLLNWSLGWLLRLLLVVPTILTLGLLLLFTTYIVNTVLLCARCCCHQALSPWSTGFFISPHTCGSHLRPSLK